MRREGECTAICCDSYPLTSWVALKGSQALLLPRNSQQIGSVSTSLTIVGAAGVLEI